MATTREDTYRSLKVVVLTFLLFAIPISTVSFLYVKQKTDYFNQRKFRQLAVQAELIRAAIDNYTKNILPKLAEASDVVTWRTLKPGTKFDLQKLNTGANFELRKIELAPEDSATRKPITPIHDGQTLWIDFEYWHDGVNYVGRAKIWSDSDTGAERLFDHLLLVDDVGNLIFEKEPAPESLLADSVRADPEGRTPAVRALDLAGLIASSDASPKKGDAPTGLAILHNSGIQKVRLADEEYELFVQPLQVAPGESGAGGPNEKELNWSLVGLTSVSRLRRESMTMSYTVVLMILFVFLLISLSWPFLKLWYQSARDRLGRSDVHLLAASLLLVTGLITFFAADAYTYPRFEDVLDDQLKALADSVHDHLQRELVAALKEARERGDERPSLSLANQDWSALYDRVAWVDGEGQQTFKWTSMANNTAAINVKSRVYFEELVSGGGWRWNVGNKPIRFWLGPVLSWTTGERLAILGVPWAPSGESKDPEKSIVTLVLRLISLRDPILPPSFSFAVVGGNGEVLFHSDRSHESENLFVETDQNTALRAAVAGRARDWISASYLGQGHRLYVRPIRGLPWSLVAFRNKDVLRTTNLEILSSAFVMFLVYMLAVMWPVAMILGWDAAWCWPSAHRNREYLHLSVVYTLVVLSMAIVIGLGTAAPILFTGVLVPPFCLWVAHRRLRRRGDGGEGRSAIAASWLLAVAALVLVVMVREGLKPWHAAPFVVLIVAASLDSIYWMNRRASPSQSPSRGTTQKRYLATAVLFVVIAGILPAVGFFRIAARVETEIYVRYAQRGVTEAYWARTRRVIAENRGRNAKLIRGTRLANSLDEYGDFFFDTWIFRDPGKWTLPVSNAATTSDTTNCGVETSNLRMAFERIRLLYNDVAVQTQELLHPTSGDCTLFWRSERDVEELALTPSPTDVPVLKSDLLDWQPPVSLNWWLMLVGGAAALLLTVVYLTRLLAARLFLIDLDDPVAPAPLDWTAKDLKRSTLILGPPFSGKSSLLKDETVRLIDLRTATSADGWAAAVRPEGVGDNRVVAIDHLEYRSDDPKTNLETLSLVERLVAAGKIVVMASAVDPLRFAFTDAEEPAPNSDTNSDRWAELLSYFTRVHVVGTGDPSGFRAELENERRSLSEPRSEPAFDTLLSECRPTAYLQSVGRAIYKGVDMRALSASQIVSEVLDRAAAYYRALWATCSRDERLALFDLAQDGFVNAENPGIPSLLRRRLLVRNPDLQLFNASFRRFVLEAGTAEEIMKWEEANAPNRWNAVKWPVLAAVVFSAFLLFLTHREVFDTGVLFVGALGGGVAGVFKLLDIFKTARSTT